MLIGSISGKQQVRSNKRSAIRPFAIPSYKSSEIGLVELSQK